MADLGLDDNDRNCWMMQIGWLLIYGWPMPGEWEHTWMGYAATSGISAAFRSMAASPEAKQRAANIRARDNGVPAQSVAEGGGALDLSELTTFFAGLGIAL